MREEFRTVPGVSLISHGSPPSSTSPILLRRSTMSAPVCEAVPLSMPAAWPTYGAGADHGVRGREGVHALAERDRGIDLYGAGHAAADRGVGRVEGASPEAPGRSGKSGRAGGGWRASGAPGPRPSTGRGRERVNTCMTTALSVFACQALAGVRRACWACP